MPGDVFFPVTHEALAPGVPSITGERGIDLRAQPVVRELERGRRQVVQNDCRAASADPAFQRMLDAFGGLAAQIVTPVFVDGRLSAILSLHQLGSRRTWSDREIALAAAAGEEVRVLVEAGRAA